MDRDDGLTIMKKTIIPFILCLVFILCQAQLPIGTVRKPEVTDSGGNVQTTPLSFTGAMNGSGFTNIHSASISGIVPVANGGTATNSTAGARAVLGVYSTNQTDALTNGFSTGGTIPANIAFTTSNNVFVANVSVLNGGNLKDVFTVGTNQQATSTSQYSGTNMMTCVSSNLGALSSVAAFIHDEASGVNVQYNDIAWGPRLTPNVMGTKNSNNYLTFNGNSVVGQIGALFQLHFHSSGVALGSAGNLEGVFVSNAGSYPITMKQPTTFWSNNIFNSSCTFGTVSGVSPISQSWATNYTMTLPSVTAGSPFVTNVVLTGSVTNATYMSNISASPTGLSLQPSVATNGTVVLDFESTIVGGVSPGTITVNIRGFQNN